MKLSIILSLTLAAAATAFASPPPLFQVRLVLDEPSADSEPMTEIVHNQDSNYTNVLNVQKTILLDQTALASASVLDELGRNNIFISLNKSGTARFDEITRQNVGKHLAIIINGKLCEAPRINAEISTGEALITAGFTEQEAEVLVKQMNDAVARP